MLELLKKPFTVAVLVVAVVNPCFARDAGDLVAPGVGGFFPASAQSDARGFEDIRATGTSALNVAQLNRVLWESSFERGIARSGDTGLVSAANPTLATAILYRADGGHQRVSHGGMLVDFSNSFIDSSTSEGLARRPGIGACLLAALAIAALAVFRRRTGYQPIVPPRPILEARVAANGAK